jgi:hypothetical protein
MLTAFARRTGRPPSVPVALWIGELTQMSHSTRAHRASGPAPAPLVALLVALLAASYASACSDEPETCDRTTDCAHNRACVDGTCQAIACRTNLNCPADAICFPADDGEGLCGAQECRTSGDCSRRELPFCVGGRCLAEAPPECAVRTDCRQGETCRSGSCVSILTGAVCDANDDCGNPEICDPNRGAAGECTPRCSDDADCEPLEGLHVCHRGSGLCVVVECLDDVHCGDAEVCNASHTCEFERFPCGELECNDPTRPFVTQPLDGQCRCVECLNDNNCTASADDVCEAGGTCICSPTNRCVDCQQPASDPTECTGERPAFREGCCVECLTSADCQHFGLGSVCQAGGCVVCDCLAGCQCTGEASCVDQGNGTGRCQLPLGQLGDSCTEQAGCDVFLACNYSSGQCVPLATGGFCGAGCPAPMRCAQVGGSAFCYGCDPQNDMCPVTTECDVRGDWIGVFDGGRCTPI